MSMNGVTIPKDFFEKMMCNLPKIQNLTLNASDMR